MGKSDKNFGIWGQVKSVIGCPHNASSSNDNGSIQDGLSQSYAISRSSNVLSNNVLPDFSRYNNDSLCLWRLLVFKFLCTGDGCRPLACIVSSAVRLPLIRQPDKHTTTSTHLYPNFRSCYVRKNSSRPYRRQPSARCFEANRDRDLLRAVVFH